jgi:hypothetical protein
LADGGERGLATQGHLRRGAALAREEFFDPNSRLLFLRRQLQGAKIVMRLLGGAAGRHDGIEACALLGRQRRAIFDAQELGKFKVILLSRVLSGIGGHVGTSLAGCGRSKLRGAAPARAAPLSIVVVSVVERAGLLPCVIVADRDAYAPITELDEAGASTGFAHPPTGRFGEAVRLAPLGEGEDAIIVACAIARALPLPAFRFA